MQKLSGDVVFSHNDLYYNNVLITQGGVQFIDYEYSFYNYLGYDIANYFSES